MKNDVQAEVSREVLEGNIELIFDETRVLESALVGDAKITFHDPLRIRQSVRTCVVVRPQITSIVVGRVSSSADASHTLLYDRYLKSRRWRCINVHKIRPSPKVG